MRKKIDYYGTTDNYIHVKFGDLRKCYNFTESFYKKYPVFCEEFEKYFNCEECVFTDPLCICNYITFFKIPVKAYFNFTDEPATWEQVKKYLHSEYRGKFENLLYRYDFDKTKNKLVYYDLDKHKKEI